MTITCKTKGQTFSKKEPSLVRNTGSQKILDCYHNNRHPTNVGVHRILCRTLEKHLRMVTCEQFLQLQCDTFVCVTCFKTKSFLNWTSMFSKSSLLQGTLILRYSLLKLFKKRLGSPTFQTLAKIFYKYISTHFKHFQVL